jgi:hypothetical protein
VVFDSQVIDDHDVLRAGMVPAEADPPLLVDPDAVLTGTISLSFSSRFPGGTRRSSRVSAASRMSSLRTPVAVVHVLPVAVVHVLPDEQAMQSKIE